MTAQVVRVSGSLVELERMPDVAMYDVVAIGDRGLFGEVVAIDDTKVTVQAYENTAGLTIGSLAETTGTPLSASLGPELLGGIFDGLLRPLGSEGNWLMPGMRGTKEARRTWSFTPSVGVGDVVSAGDELGRVNDAGAVPLLLLVPAELSGVVDRIAPAGRYSSDAEMAHVGGRPIALSSRWPVRRPRPFLERLGSGEPLLTGQRVLDLIYPVARGSAACVPGGFGTGKTVLLQQIAKWCDADVIVYVGCGERGNEMADVVNELRALSDPRTGEPLSRRTVIVANTSNMPMMAREASIYTGVTVAEYFRDMGYHVVVIADSTSRWAEALREFASRTGELPAEEGYPAGLASALAAFYARSANVVTLGGRQGSVTIIGAISPPGGDLTEPVTAHTQRFVRGVWLLDRDLAYARHYPAVAWSGSFSRDTDDIGVWHSQHGDPAWAGRRARVAAILAEADRLASLADLVGLGSMPGPERMVMLTGRLLRDVVLQQSALSATDAHCSVAKGAALVDGVLSIADACQRLIEAGVPASAVEEVDFGPLVRAREETEPDDGDGVRTRCAAVAARLEDLT
jgi:V/A-type H+-transporting ATPase subunit A